MNRAQTVLAAALVSLLGGEGRAEALAPGKYLLDPGGRVLGVRALDVDGDGRPDLVALVRDPATAEQHVLVLRTPAEPVKRSYYPPDHVTRIECDGRKAAAGCLSVGRFGPRGETRLRFLTPEGVVEVGPDGGGEAFHPNGRPTLFGRSRAEALFFWDGVADLDGDGIDELWYPLGSGNGPIHVLGGRRGAASPVLALWATNLSTSGAGVLMSRTAHVPNLFPADLDGDGHRELVALREHDLVAWTPMDAKADGPDERPLQPTYRLRLPFLDADPSLGPEDQHTPRIQLADVDGDGVTDLLVTLITGKRTRVESLRTILFHYPGPFRDAATGELVKPRARLDTQSVALHPTFVDMDGDGDLEYVGDSIRGSRLDLIARVLGQDPAITYVGFRFDEKAGTYEPAPYFTDQRTYPSAEALSNRFGRTARLDGDFDGDGHTDLLDLGNLGQVEVVRAKRRTDGGGDPLVFEGSWVPPVPVKEGLVADALVVDLNGDRRADAVLWSAKSIFFIVSRGGP